MISRSFHYEVECRWFSHLNLKNQKCPDFNLNMKNSKCSEPTLNPKQRSRRSTAITIVTNITTSSNVTSNRDGKLCWRNGNSFIFTFIVVWSILWSNTLVQTNWTWPISVISSKQIRQQRYVWPTFHSKNQNHQSKWSTKR